MTSLSVNGLSRRPTASSRSSRASVGRAAARSSGSQRQITRSRTLDAPVTDHATLLHLSSDLLDAELPPPLGIRLMGVTLSGFRPHAEPVDELPLFATAAEAVSGG